jgi:hypothetical protein
MGTKTLVLIIRHYIRELSGVFSVCHAWGDITFPAIFIVVLKIQMVFGSYLKRN